MQRSEQPRFMRHARGQAVVVAQSQPNFHHRFLVMGAYLIASAIIALWMVYLPTLAGNVLTQLNILPQHRAANAVNRLHEGDPLAAARFDERWSALGVAKRANTGKSAERIPFGCEGAFSRLVKKGNFTARCIAAIDMPTKFAAVE
jgi:hypothetical protein